MRCLAYTSAPLELRVCGFTRPQVHHLNNFLCRYLLDRLISERKPMSDRCLSKCRPWPKEMCLWVSSYGILGHHSCTWHKMWLSSEEQLAGKLSVAIHIPSECYSAILAELHQCFESEASVLAHMWCHVDPMSHYSDSWCSLARSLMTCYYRLIASIPQLIT